MFADWLAGATITLGERSQRGTSEIRAWVWKGVKKTLCVSLCMCVRVCALTKSASDDLLLF